MEVKGNHSFSISKKELWDLLMDPSVLAKITPGVSALEAQGDDTFKTVSKIKIGPVSGQFKGDLSVVDKNEPHAFAIEMKQLSRIGNANVRVQMILEDGDDGSTVLNFDGKAKLSGLIARTGQRVLSGVANVITKEVFASLDEHIENTKSDKIA